MQDAKRTTVTDPPSRPETLLSRDANWWWTGSRWVAARAPDGLWRWDGVRWHPTIDLARQQPRDLAVSLTLLAEDRYARAGEILVERAREWSADAQRQKLIAQARRAKRRFWRVIGVLAGWTDVKRWFHRFTRAGNAQQEERQPLRSDHRSALVRLGRAAPQPTVKEADDLIAVARSLDQRAGPLTAALADADKAEIGRAEAVTTAQVALMKAEEARRQAVQRAKMAVEETEDAWVQAVREAKGRLTATRSPGPGELQTQIGELQLYGTVLNTPGGRLPAAGAVAVLGTAAELWRDHRAQLAYLAVLGAPDAKASVEALAEVGDQRFLLLVGHTGAGLWACPASDVEAAERFASAVNEWAPKAERAQQERESQAREIEVQLQALREELGSADARAELSRVEADRVLLDAIDEARLGVEQAGADTRELEEAWRRVSDVARQLATPPEPLEAEEA